MMRFCKRVAEECEKKICKKIPESWAVKYLELKLKRTIPYYHTWKKVERQSDECIIMASGPSVLAQKEKIRTYAHKADFITLNSFVDLYGFAGKHQVLHVVVDPAYFDEEFTSHPSILKVKDMLAKCSTPCMWGVPMHFYDKAQEMYSLSQSVTPVGIPIPQRYQSLPETIQFALADKGLRGFGAQSVPVPALYMAIVSGYKKIWLAGCDADMARNIRVNENGILLFSQGHVFFPESDCPQPDFSVSEWIACEHRYFLEFECLSAYAKKHGVSIVNLSLKSLLDMFPKGGLGESPFPHYYKSYTVSQYNELLSKQSL